MILLKFKKHLPYLLVLWILPGAIYLKSLQPSLYFIDAGVTVAAAHTLGIPTPPGYPSYTVLAHLFGKLPLGAPLFRLQLFSIFISLSTLTLVYFFILRVFQTGFSFLSEGKKTNSPPNLLALGASLMLGFSYEFWSQTGNIQAYIFTDLMLLLAVYLLLFLKNEYKNVTKIGLGIALLLGLAAGGSTVMVFMIAPLGVWVLCRVWNQTGFVKTAALGLITLLAVAAVYSYLPLRARVHPFLNWGDPQTFSRFFAHVQGMGLSFNDPVTGKITGFTGNPVEFVKVAGRYFYLTFLQFTPLALLPLLVGLYFVFKKNRELFFGLLSIPLTNLIFGGLWLSGNQEAWFILSYIVFAIFIGIGLVPLYQYLTRLKRFNALASAAIVLIIVFPLLHWFLRLDRHTSYYMSDYADNLYKNLPKDAVLIGIYDTFQAATLQKHEVAGDRKDVFPVMTNMLYILPWYREHLRSLQPDLVPTGLDSMARFDRESEYSEMLDFYITWLIDKGKKVYVSGLVFSKSVLVGSNAGYYKPDPKKLKAIPAGLTFRMEKAPTPEGGRQSGAPNSSVILNDSEGSLANASTYDSNKLRDSSSAFGGTQNDKKEARNDASSSVREEDFQYTFRNPGEYGHPRYFLERGYISSYQDLVSEYAISYIAYAEELFNSKSVVGNQAGTNVILGTSATRTPESDSGQARMTDRKGDENNFKKAKEYLNKAYLIAPKSLEVLNRLSISYASQGNFRKASEFFKKAYELNPDNLQLKFNLAKVYADSGNTFEAKKIFQEIVDNKLDQQAATMASQQLGLIAQASQIPLNYQTFQNDAMNLKFNYPQGFATTFVSNNVVKLTNNATDKEELTMLFYSTKIGEDQSINELASNLPFIIDGMMLSNQPAGIQGFQSQFRLYATGKDTVLLLLLRANDQAFAVRIFPADSEAQKEFGEILKSIRVSSSSK